MSVTDSGELQYVSLRQTRTIDLRSGLLAVIHSATQGSECMPIVQWLVICVRTGPSVYGGSRVAGDLCQDWSVSVWW